MSKEFFKITDARLSKIEDTRREEEEEEETDDIKESRCAELREQRVRPLAEVMGDNEAIKHWRDNITKYELNFELQKALRMSPEERYQNKKNRWLWHESSWWMRRFTTIPPLTDYDGQGCNNTGCIPECRFYESTGRIEYSELIELEEEEDKNEQELIGAKYRLLGLNDNDSNDIKKQKWQEIHEVKVRILDLTGEFLRQRQHTGCKWEEV